MHWGKRHGMWKQRMTFSILPLGCWIFFPWIKPCIPCCRATAIWCCNRCCISWLWAALLWKKPSLLSRHTISLFLMGFMKRPSSAWICPTMKKKGFTQNTMTYLTEICTLIWTHGSLKRCRHCPMNIRWCSAWKITPNRHIWSKPCMRCMNLGADKFLVPPFSSGSAIVSGISLSFESAMKNPLRHSFLARCRARTPLFLYKPIRPRRASRFYQMILRRSYARCWKNQRMSHCSLM